MSDKVIYHLQAPQQKRWNGSTGQYDQVDPYTSVVPIFGVMITDGAGETDDRKTAIEFFDMGYTVTPDPHVTQKADGGEPDPKKWTERVAPPNEAPKRKSKSKAKAPA